MAKNLTSRRTRKVAFAGATLAAMLAATPAGADQHVETSADFIRNLADRAITAITDGGQTDATRREQFRSLFREAFAIKGISRFALDRHWVSASDSQRRDYTALFEDCVVSTWADRFSNYSGQRFVVDEAIAAPSASGSERVAIVRSTVFGDQQTPTRIDWRVASAGELYKITDVSIEGVSLAIAQRDEFSSVIRANDGELDALLERLRNQQSC